MATNQNQGTPLSPSQEHSCEICGAAGLTDDQMREHTRACHVEGNAVCPFCGLNGVAPAELLLHVNQAHLDYLTPENELMSFIDDQSPSIDGDSDSISECRGISPTITSMPGIAFNKLNGGSSLTATTATTTASSSSSSKIPATNSVEKNHYTNHQTSTSAQTNRNCVHNNSNNFSSNLNKEQQQQQQPQQIVYSNGQHQHKNGSILKHGGGGVGIDRSQSKIQQNTSIKQNMSSNLINSREFESGSSSSCSSSSVSTFQTKMAASGSASMMSCSDSSTQMSNSDHKVCDMMDSGMISSVGGGSVSSCSSSNGGGIGNGINGSREHINGFEKKIDGGQGSPLRSNLGLNLKSNSPASNIRSPLKCPLCSYSSSSLNILEEHINRAHFDPVSPSVISNNGAHGNGMGTTTSSTTTSSTSSLSSSSATTLTTTTNGTSHYNDTLTALACPICGRAFESPPDLELHVNIEHRDILSPARIDSNDITSSGVSPCNGGTTSSRHICPVCNMSMDNMKTTQEMELHIENHFTKSPVSSGSSTMNGASNCGIGSGNGTNATANGGGGGGGGGAGGIYCGISSGVIGRNGSGNKHEPDLGKQAQKLREQREFEMLRAQYGMDDQGNFREQSAAGMQRAVYAGEMSVADYYERQVGLRAAESHGIDDGTSCTKSVVPRVHSLSSTSPNIIRSLLCTAVDHYASSYGDKGWGCGYRNLQMLLSSLLQNTTYNEALYSAWGNQGPSRTAMPSISRLQKMVEAAWAQGFDVQGSEQLGCKLYNTRKWIGATEVVTVLSWLRINCQLIDFHRPTSSDGRHLELFNWVYRYFDEPRVFSPPLYLQHQGHSRTIIGIEQRASGLQLLILDPSHGPRQVAALGSSQDSLRLIRRGSAAMRAPQYQIVAVKGLIDTEEQYQESKILRSIRIPPDC